MGFLSDKVAAFQTEFEEQVQAVQEAFDDETQAFQAEYRAKVAAFQADLMAQIAAFQAEFSAQANAAKVSFAAILGQEPGLDAVMPVTDTTPTLAVYHTYGAGRRVELRRRPETHRPQRRRPA